MAPRRWPRLLGLALAVGALAAPATASAGLDMSQIAAGQYADGSTISFFVDASGDVYGYQDSLGYSADVCETADFGWYSVQSGGTLFTATCTQPSQVPYFTDYWSATVPMAGEATSFSGTVQQGESLNANLVSDGAMVATAVASPSRIVSAGAAAAGARTPTTDVRIRCTPWPGRQLDALGRCHGNVQLRTAAGAVVAERYVHVDANRTRTLRLPTTRPAQATGGLVWRIDHYDPATGALRTVQVRAAR